MEGSGRVMEATIKLMWLVRRGCWCSTNIQPLSCRACQVIFLPENHEKMMFLLSEGYILDERPIALRGREEAFYTTDKGKAYLKVAEKVLYNQ